MQEKRSKQRVRAVGQYRIGGSLNFPMEIVDISEGGAGIVSHGPLDIGAMVEVDLYFPDGSEFTTSVRVRWTKPGPRQKTYAAGLQFVTLSDEARRKIFEFVETHQALPA